MSGLLAGKVWQSALPPHLKPLAAALADIGDDDGARIYPSVAYAAWLLGRDERTVQLGLRELRELGILRAVSGGKGGRGRSTEYRMIEAKLPARAPWAEHRKTLQRAVKGENPESVSPFIEDAERVKSTTEKGEISALKGEISALKGEIYNTERVKLATPDPLEEPLREPLEDPPTTVNARARADGGSGSELARPAAVDARAFEQSVMSYVAGRLSRQNFETWIGRCGVVREGVALKFLAPNAQVAEWISGRFRIILGAAAQQFGFERYEVQVVA